MNEQHPITSGLEGKGGVPTRRRQWQLLEKHQTPQVSPLHPTLSHAPGHFPACWVVCGEGEPASLTWTQEAQWGARVPH